MSSVQFLLLLLLFVQVNQSSTYSNSQLFNTWSRQHAKIYPSEEEKLSRSKVFQDNLAFITQHNSMKNSTYTLSLNDFADLTHQEFVDSRLGLKVSNRFASLQSIRKPSLRDSKLVAKIPSSVDWRNEGAVTPVKNQGNCSASWAFAATGAIEGVNKIATGSLVSLSELELISCDKSYNNGCSGGVIDSAFRWATEHGGIVTEKDYRERDCNKNRSKQEIVTIQGYADVLPNDEEQLLQAVASQPVSAGICASERAFQFYSKGIFNGPCSKPVDHGILIVGYDSENGSDYWIVKNSWGTHWGMDGYIHVQRNSGKQEGVCGINTLASYPIKVHRKPALQPSLILPPLTSPRCDLLRTCAAGEKCCCSKRFIICWTWVCCRVADGVCCDGLEACCPSCYICDVKGGCHKDYGNTTAMKELIDRPVWNIGD